MTNTRQVKNAAPVRDVKQLRQTQLLKQAQRFFRNMLSAAETPQPASPQSESTQSDPSVKIKTPAYYAAQIEGIFLSTPTISYKNLDPDGLKSEEEIKAQFHGALRDYYTPKAQAIFEKMQSPGETNALKLHDSMRQALRLGRIDYAALDKEGLKTNEEMQLIVEKVLQQHHIAEARHYFSQLQNGDFDDVQLSPEALRMKIDASLGNARVTITALDPQGTTKRGAMQNTVKDAVKEAHFRLARKYFDALKDSAEKGNPLPEDATTCKLRLTSHLIKSGKHLKDLMPEKDVSNQQVKEKLELYVLSAQFDAAQPQKEGEKPVIRYEDLVNPKPVSSRIRHDEDSGISR